MTDHPAVIEKRLFKIAKRMHRRLEGLPEMEAVGQTVTLLEMLVGAAHGRLSSGQVNAAILREGAYQSGMAVDRLFKSIREEERAMERAPEAPFKPSDRLNNPPLPDADDPAHDADVEAVRAARKAAEKAKHAANEPEPEQEPVPEPGPAVAASEQGPEEQGSSASPSVVPGAATPSGPESGPDTAKTHTIKPVKINKTGRKA